MLHGPRSHEAEGLVRPCFPISIWSVSHDFRSNLLPVTNLQSFQPQPKHNSRYKTQTAHIQSHTLILHEGYWEILWTRVNTVNEWKYQNACCCRDEAPIFGDWSSVFRVYSNVLQSFCFCGSPHGATAFNWSLCTVTVYSSQSVLDKLPALNN